MGDVIELRPAKKIDEDNQKDKRIKGEGATLLHTSYYDVGGDLGVIMKDESILMLCLDYDEFLIVTGDTSITYTRAQLAEWLHLCSIFVDGDNKYCPGGEFVTMAYKNE